MNTNFMIEWVVIKNQRKSYFTGILLKVLLKVHVFYN